jgi:hypothetical protein
MSGSFISPAPRDTFYTYKLLSSFDLSYENWGFPSKVPKDVLDELSRLRA